YVPIEAITADSATSLVYKRNGSRVTKQEVETGTMSDGEVVSLQGLEEGDRVLLTPPADHESMKVAHLTGPRLNPKPLQGDTAQSAVLQAKSADIGKPVPSLRSKAGVTAGMTKAAPSGSSVVKTAPARKP